jgi:hypothetical protein
VSVDGIRFREADRADSAAIVALLNGTFRTQIDPATWEWYVYGNPLGPSRVYVAADGNDALVGVIGFAPISLRLEGATIEADFAHHLVLTPKYRDTMSFVALNRYALGAQERLGIRLVIGPPNRTAYPIHKTLMKWREFGFLECLRKTELQTLKHSCRPVTTFPLDFDAFYARVSRDMQLCLNKNRQWVNWRFLERPGAPYQVLTAETGKQLSGYIVLKRWVEPDGYRKVHIIDIHADSADVVGDLVAAAETWAGNADELNLWAVKGYAYRGALTALGFAPNTAAHQPLIARRYDRLPIAYPEGRCAFSYGDGDTLY